MSLTLELADKKEAAPKAKAQARGLSAEQYVQQIVDRDLEETDRDLRSVWDIFAENRKRLPPEEFARLPITTSTDIPSAANEGGFRRYLFLDCADQRS
jgi:hypothetical protein